MPSDYYIVLGIERGADLSQIKQAYREASKRYHPDVVGGDINSGKFIEAREAYEVLSDLDKRRAYDAQLKRRKTPVPTPRPEATIPRPSPLWQAVRRSPTLIDDFFEGLVPGFYGRRSATESIHKDLYLQVILSPAEALRGGVFPVSVPILRPCPACDASGWRGGLSCPSCRGSGAERSSHEFNLVIPPGTRAETTVDVAMDGIGLQGVRLWVDVQISAAPGQ
jgi:molecular chaperone DnaJ